MTSHHGDIQPGWWSQLYDPSQPDTAAAGPDSAGQPGPDSPDGPPPSGLRPPESPDSGPHSATQRTGRSHIRGGGRLPDWRTGQKIPLSPDNPATPAHIAPAGGPLSDVPALPETWPPAPANPGGPHQPPIIVQVTAEPQPSPRWDWSWLAHRIRPWSSLIGAVVVLEPWLGGNSITGEWSGALHQTRTTAGILPAYALAGTTLALALVLDERRHTWWTRAIALVALLGGTGALGWFDPITALTGVHA